MVPDTEHTAAGDAENVTASPDVALADIVNGGAPTDLPLSPAKLMVCAFNDAVNVCDTRAAALKLASPTWSAAMVHCPAPFTVTVVPEMVQMPGVNELNVTPRPEVALADIANGAAPASRFDKASKVMLCPFNDTENDCVTGGAAL